MERNNKFRIPTLILILLATFKIAEGAAINTDMALTPSEGTAIVRSQLRYMRAADDPSGMDREMRRIIWSNTFVYGVSGRMALVFNIPLIDLDVDSNMGSMMDETGLGDMKIISKYRFWQRDVQGATDRISGIFGLEIPSGKDDLSSHSLDPILGLVYTHQALANNGRIWEVDADVLQIINTEARDVDLGDVIRYDFAVSYQVWPSHVADLLLIGILELNGAVSERDRINGIEVPDTGGGRLYLSPGMGLVTKRFIVEAGVQIPILQDLHGDQLEEDYSLSAGFRVQF